MGYIYGGVDPSIIFDGHGGGEKTVIQERSLLCGGHRLTKTDEIRWRAFFIEEIEQRIDDRFTPDSHNNPNRINAWMQENRRSIDQLLDILSDRDLNKHLHDFVEGYQEYSDAHKSKDSQKMIAALAKQFKSEQGIRKYVKSSVESASTSSKCTIF